MELGVEFSPRWGELVQDKPVLWASPFSLCLLLFLFYLRVIFNGLSLLI